MAFAQKTSIDEKLKRIHREEEEEKAKQLAQKLDLPYANLAALPIDADTLSLIDEKSARQAQIASIGKSEGKIKIAALNPETPAAQNIIKSFSKKGLAIVLFIVSRHSLKKAFAAYEKIVETEKEITGAIEIRQSVSNQVKILTDIKTAFETAQSAAASATKLLEIALSGALQFDASDIHLEGTNDGAILRYRIDGILRDTATLTAKTYKLLLSRIKLLAGMALNIRDKAQDGRFTTNVDKEQIEVRVSSIPSALGENIAMRLLNPKAINFGLKDLGLREDLMELIAAELKRPNGMMIVTGPTGSGKTTTLYTFLKEKVSPEIEIITLEDPIEYRLKGVSQTQVEAERGYTFASSLRAVLRQDPNIILVGEIRDKETAEIALQASLTGHIVFSTLHTNDAAGAIPRFIDIGVNPSTLSAGLIDIMAQRLLRRVCPNCKKEYQPTPQERKKIVSALKKLPKMVLAPEISAEFKLAKGAGCAACGGSGYKGRVGVFEIIKVDSDLEKLIIKSPSHAEILELIESKGFVPMYADGIIKALQGVTTIEELENVVGVEKE